MYEGFSGWGNGLLFDARGRLYVGSYGDDHEAALVRVDRRGAKPTPLLTGKGFAGMAFGRGPLDCGDFSSP